MRLLPLIVLALSATASAEERPLRFSVTESWAMPMMRIENGQATGGILYDLQNRLAQKVGRRAELQVMPRMRVQQIMVRGEIDVRCYVNPAWLQESHYQYIWSVPFMSQRDVLVTRGLPSQDLRPEQLHGKAIGTVLGFTYPRLEPLFTRGQLLRDDARTQELVLDKLFAHRYDYAVSNDQSLQWYNHHQPPERQLHEGAELANDLMSCIVRDEPDVPTMQLLRAMVRMKEDGEFDAILARYR